jgi:hypothetical protein
MQLRPEKNDPEEYRQEVNSLCFAGHQARVFSLIQGT